MVASDRLSAFDVIMGEPHPRQGRAAHADGAVLVRQARPHLPQPPHRRCPESVVKPEEVAQVRGRSMLVQRLKPIPVEAVVRGYLAGSGWKGYQESRSVCGVPLPEGLTNAAKLPSPSTPPPPRPPWASTTRTSPSSAPWR